MKKGFVALVLLAIALAPWPGAGAQQSRYRVLIDPAHGGEEMGVVSDRLREKDIAVNLALLIRKETQQNANFDIQLTRSEDRTVTQAERRKAAAQLKPD